MLPETIAAAPPETAPTLRRRRWFPWLAGTVIVLALGLPRVWEWAEWNPDPLMQMKFMGQFVAMVCAALLVVWFFLFSCFSGRSRLVALGVILLAAGSFKAAVRKVELTGSWQPIFHIRWDPDPTTALDEHLKRPAAVAALP